MTTLTSKKTVIFSLLILFILIIGLSLYYINVDSKAATEDESVSNSSQEQLIGDSTSIDENDDTEILVNYLEVTTIYEAEDAALSDVSIANATPGYSGTGYVTGFTNDTGSVSFAITTSTPSTARLSIGYRTPHGEKNTNFLFNGQAQGEIHFPPNTEFSEVAAGIIVLEKGDNTVTLEKSWGWYDIDYIKLEPVDQEWKNAVPKNLINPNASNEALSLMSFLVDQYGKSILSGQQEYPNNNYRDINYIHEHTGKTPAVLGLDFIDNSPSRVENGTAADEVSMAINWWQKGGIVAFTWHWNAPKDLIDQPGKEWWRGFYTDATTFDIEYALANQDSEDYALLLRDIDAISEEIMKLQDKNVPILWRPLHEAEGGWFWWGAKGPEPTIELWKLMYERMTNHHQLNNLIWVWNSVSEEWYPGNDFVDIVSYDSYPGPYNYGAVSTHYENLIQLTGNKKLIALAENGPIPDPEEVQKYQAYWSWFSTWDGNIIREHNSTKHLEYVYNHPFVMNLEDLPDLKNYTR